MLLHLCDSTQIQGKGSSFQKNDVLHIKYMSKESTPYLFKWSKRKRNVTRLGSGSDNKRFNIQLSFATGSESATRQKITSPQAVNENLTDCIISQTNKYRWSWIDCNYIIDWKVRVAHQYPTGSLSFISQTHRESFSLKQFKCFWTFSHYDSFPLHQDKVYPSLP